MVGNGGERLPEVVVCLLLLSLPKIHFSHVKMGPSAKLFESQRLRKFQEIREEGKTLIASPLPFVRGAYFIRRFQQHVF